MTSQAFLGVMLLDTTFPRIPGDVGHPGSYPFPVKLVTVRGATVQRAVYEADPSLLDLFVEVAQQLEVNGAVAITSSCGFLTPLQEKVSQSVHIPVFLSSLLQVPLAHAMTGGRIAILTASAPNLTHQILRPAGILDEIPIVIGGMQDSAAFSEPILKGAVTLDKAAIQADVLNVGQKLLRENTDISAFVLECHNLAPYGQALQAATGKPVFDIISYAEWVFSTIVKRSFASSAS